MKSFLLATTALYSIASALPSAPWIQLAPPPAGTQFYQLQTTSPTAAVSGQWVTLPSGSTSYSLAAAQTAATTFFMTQYNATGTYALHNADDTRQLALQGESAALLYLVDATDPSSDKIPQGQLMEWATFTTEGDVLGVEDGSTLTNRTFVAVGDVDAGFTLALYDGLSNVTQTIAPLTINVVEAA